MKKNFPITKSQRSLRNIPKVQDKITNVRLLFPCSAKIPPEMQVKSSETKVPRK